MATPTEKTTAEDPSVLHHNDTPATHGFDVDSGSLPPGYFRSPFFLGSMLATGLGLCASVGGFGLAAPNLTIINQDIGPSTSISWVALVYTLVQAVGLLLVGRLSDMFGRRYFFIGSAIIALLGCVVCAVAKNVETLIGGTALIGLAASGQLSFAFIVGELTPMKYRFAANACMYFFCIPFAAFGPACAKALVLYTAAGWRWCYYVLIIINFVSGALFTAFYFPPTFHEKFHDRKPIEQLKKVDFIGIFLWAAGLFIFLLGLSWGGQAYPWSSAAVIATLVIGGATVAAFAGWEWHVSKRRSAVGGEMRTEPLLPIHLFSNVGWIVSCVILGLEASVYYGMAVVWPQMIAVLYTDDGGASMYGAILSCLPSLMITAGQIIGGFLAEPIGKTRIQLMIALAIGGACLGAVAAATPDNRSIGLGTMIVSTFAIGWVESVVLTLSGIELLDQREIGTAIGAAGSIRSTLSTLGSAVYLSVLSNRLSERVPAEVIPAVTAAGLPSSSVPAYLGGFTTGSFVGVQGLNDQIAMVGARANRVASAQAYSTVFLTTIAFSAIALILSFWAPNVDDKMTGHVVAKLHGKEGETAQSGLGEKEKHVEQVD